MIYEILEAKDLILGLTLLVGFFVITWKINTIPDSDNFDAQW